jgi:ABC-type multidrug transport system fused ATPase/permease subunit
VHVAPNGALYLGVTVILLALNVRLGLAFGVAGLGALLATLLGARAMYRRSKKYRKKEGQLADRIDRALRGGAVEPEFETTNTSSGRHEAKLTRAQSLTTWSVYILYGLGVLAAVWIGTHEIASGRLEPRDMVLFLMYALIIRGPTVRLARQGSRLGKTIATADRVVRVLYREAAAPAADAETGAEPLEVAAAVAGSQESP